MKRSRGPRARTPAIGVYTGREKRNEARARAAKRGRHATPREGGRREADGPRGFERGGRNLWTGQHWRLPPLSMPATSRRAYSSRFSCSSRMTSPAWRSMHHLTRSDTVQPSNPDAARSASHWASGIQAETAWRLSACLEGMTRRDYAYTPAQSQAQNKHSVHFSCFSAPGVVESRAWKQNQSKARRRSSPDGQRVASASRGLCARSSFASSSNLAHGATVSRKGSFISQRKRIAFCSFSAPSPAPCMPQSSLPEAKSHDALRGARGAGARGAKKIKCYPSLTFRQLRR